MDNRVSVPSDPNERCTPEQLDSIFGGQHRLDAMRELVSMLRKAEREKLSAMQGRGLGQGENENVGEG